MLLQRADLWWLRFPLPRPHTAAHGTTTEREVLVLRLTRTDGVVGWGECDALEHPGYSPEFTAGAWRSLTSKFLPATLADAVALSPDEPMASAAVRTALLDAELRARGMSLSFELGAVATAVPSTAVCAEMASLDALVDLVGRRLSEGHRSIKVKIRPGWDRQPIEALRMTWPDLMLAVDANGSYGDADDALDALSSFEGLGVAYVEQPLPPGDLLGSAHLAAALGVPVALDEAVVSDVDCEAALRLRAGNILNVKLARLGGPREAADIAARAAENGWDCFCGGMLEAGVGRAASLAIAALPACTLPTDLGPSERYLAPDIAPEVRLGDDGCLPVPQGPGIGINPDLGRLEALSLAHWERLA